jgi:hypothetical protein
VAQLSAAPTDLLPTSPVAARPAALSERRLDAPPEVQLRPATTRLNRPEQLTGSDARIDIALLVRHRHRLGQFPRLRRFLERAGQLDPNSSGYDAYVRTYLATSGLTEGLLREAARQAAWYDTQTLA